MNQLPVVDLIIIGFYLVGMVLVGVYFSKKNKTAEEFTRAAGRIPGWAIGISIYATFLSSNTFLGVPGKAFGTNWNAFVFSLSMPFAAWIATKYFVPFYRSTGEVSAYTHLEKRFGSWARTYAVICFLLTQLARIGSIFFGISLTLQALTGYSMVSIMLVTGVCIVIYTVLGGIEAVIWTEVVQGVLKTLGAVVILYLVVKEVPGGVQEIIDIGQRDNKFNLGTFSPDFFTSSFWVVLLYGFFINLNNFGMDQNYVQRYHTANSAKEAGKSVWLCVWIYLPVSLLFFVIGSCLYAYYQQQPDWIQEVSLRAASERLNLPIESQEVIRLASTLQPSDYGDKIMPHFMVHKIPKGLLGLIISALLSAAMSTISSGMNASATVFTEDIYKRYFAKTSGDHMKILYSATVLVGVLGMLCGMAMIGIKSILDAWWTLSGIFAAGMLGLFLLGIWSKDAKDIDAKWATAIGILVILWMTLSPFYGGLMLHSNMTIVVGTLTIFLVGNFMQKRRVS
ncbi:sodium:solute symporter [Leadbetterella byssophila]|uniref:SSS sodium solute transporter superfamily n=1 Tax=Leadbetterella byssophila (strain DSM 17132 / JCM 16389 / KACC 11308 / NBRC 106382 / 4M15) TaxID=649349 RepID=E4RRA4_LEAB4|nr:sodium:solute symporter [Leadbetterella byssophila]ADQ17590.1 SSS sodium solute transporter superfamily [Leadbetterella byssophila DSM 17132]